MRQKRPFHFDARESTISARIGELQEEMDRAKQRLTEHQAEMSHRSFSSESRDNYRICIIKDD